MRFILLMTSIFVTQLTWSQNKQAKQLQSILDNVWTDFHSFRGKVHQVFAGDTTYVSTFVIQGVEKAEIHNTIDQNSGLKIFIPARYIATIRTNINQEEAKKMVDEWKTAIMKILGKDCIVQSFSQVRPGRKLQTGYGLKTDRLHLLLQSLGKDDSFDVTLTVQRLSVY